MNQEELICFCVDVRAALESMTRKDHCHLSSFGQSNFPMGCCGDTSQLLAYLLHKQFGIVPEVFSGRYYTLDHNYPPSGLSDGNSHAWLVVNGKTVDLTADQFNDRGYNHPSVMITSDTTFHDFFADRELQPLPGYEGPLPDELIMTASQVQKILKDRGWN
ncbi:hypothetical protein [Dickeya chrysanthemi]|uniref:hypothetical protein n=1 Tax=Dickeya chrysanthemi TaxID=556 RepID=UPI0004841D62|nr:hypothetical protein [Dickeya chrysanthemi]